MIIHGMTPADWSLVSHGYGDVKMENDSVFMSPKPSTDWFETHAGLVTSNRFSKNPVKNFEIEVTVTTIKQLRTPKPKAWECFWLLFNYTTDPNTGKKNCNYLLVKPGVGIELGIAYAELGQNFIATNFDPKLIIGATSRWWIKKTDYYLFVGVNGKQAFCDKYVNLNNTPGTFGLYTEDAAVNISRFLYL